MHDLSESDGVALDRLEDIEVLLMNFERERERNGDWRALVHELFRNVHNLKSILAMAGHDSASRVVHQLESRLDLLRSGKQQPDQTWADPMLQAVDALRSLIFKGDGESETQETLDQAYSGLCVLGSSDDTAPDSFKAANPALELGFSLDAKEMAQLEQATRRQERPYILEKLIDAQLKAESIAGLPIFQTLREIGSAIAWRLKTAGSAGQVLSILFTTAQKDDDLSFAIFDPFYPVSVPDQQPLDQLPRILIVDDDKVALLILQNYLVPFGRVDSALRGDEALEKFKGALAQDPYGIVFLDIMMPGMDGHETFKRIREVESAAKILVGYGCRVVMASALSDFNSISASFSDLCDSYLVKPFERASVEDVMHKLGFKRISVDSSRVPG